MQYKIILWLLFFSATCISADKLKVLYEWDYFDFDWISEDQKSAAVASGDYNKTKSVSIDVDKWKDKVFVTVIRDKGVPASLNTISNKTGPGGPLLSPYPSWDWTNKSDCNSIIGVYRVAIDKCDRLWVLDTGKIGQTKVCPASLFIFNLHTDKLIKHIVIPDSVAENPKKVGLLVTPVVQIFGRCERYMVYMADVDGYGLVVYNGEKFWRLSSPTFQADENVHNFTIAGESFILDDGILGMALEPGFGYMRKLWYKPLASKNLNSINTGDLALSGYGSTPNINSYKDVLPSQSAAMAFSKDGVLFFGLVHEVAIACWYYRNPVNWKYMAIDDQNDKTLQFASGVKIAPNGEKEMLLVSTNRLQKSYAGTMKFDEVNFRILGAGVDDLIKGTICQPPNNPRRYSMGPIGPIGPIFPPHFPMGPGPVIPPI